MKFFSLIIIFFMNMENFKCQENKDCVGFATYTCAPHLYGGDSYEYSWCDNRGKCGCAVRCNKGPNKGDTCIGTCENVCCIGGLLAQSICLGINTEWNVKCDEKAGQQPVALFQCISDYSCKCLNYLLLYFLCSV